MRARKVIAAFLSLLFCTLSSGASAAPRKSVPHEDFSQVISWCMDQVSAWQFDNGIETENSLNLVTLTIDGFREVVLEAIAPEERHFVAQAMEGTLALLDNLQRIMDDEAGAKLMAYEEWKESNTFRAHREQVGRAIERGDALFEAGRILIGQWKDLASDSRFKRFLAATEEKLTDGQARAHLEGLLDRSIQFSFVALNYRNQEVKSGENWNVLVDLHLKRSLIKRDQDKIRAFVKRLEDYPQTVSGTKNAIGKVLDNLRINGGMPHENPSVIVISKLQDFLTVFHGMTTRWSERAALYHALVYEDSRMKSFLAEPSTFDVIKEKVSRISQLEKDLERTIKVVYTFRDARKLRGY